MNIYRIIFFFSLFFCFACGRPDAVNTMEEMDGEKTEVLIPPPSLPDSSVFGIYRGILPCDDCEGIQYSLELTVDNRYRLKRYYLGGSDKVKESEGKFKYFEKENSIRISPDQEKISFKIKENILHLLDQNQEPMVTPISESAILYKKEIDLISAQWELYSIEGEAVEEPIQSMTFLRFRADGSLVFSGGCNRCQGRFKSDIPNEIYIKPGACTKRACPYIEQKDEIMAELFKRVAYYQIKGKQLIFKNGKKELLMVFSTPF